MIYINIHLFIYIYLFEYIYIYIYVPGVRIEEHIPGVHTTEHATSRRLPPMRCSSKARCSPAARGNLTTTQKKMFFAKGVCEHPEHVLWCANWSRGRGN